MGNCTGIPILSAGRGVGSFSHEQHQRVTVLYCNAVASYCARASCAQPQSALQQSFGACTRAPDGRPPGTHYRASDDITAAVRTQRKVHLMRKR